MTALVVGRPQQGNLRRWILAALVMLIFHTGLLAAVIVRPFGQPMLAATGPAILVDLPPASASPGSESLDLAPGPTQQQADAPAQRAETRPVEATVAPTPPQQNPVVALPPDPKTQPSTPPLKAEHAAVKKPSDHTPAPRTSATPKAERRASVANADTSRSAAAAASNYGGLLSAHLQRFKQYPAASRASGEQGTAVVAFTVSRNGQVLGSHISRSSGHSALDAETLGLLRRAQPLPRFPAEMPEASKSFIIPFPYSLR